MSAAFNVFAKAVARRKAIPFELSVAEDLFFSESHQRELVRRAEDLDAGLNCITFEMDELSTFETMTQKEIAAFIQAKKKSQGIA
jgi:antitoxin component of RelBE/YafQ-DinJ toxin-antitoxin module